tara:strand:+ start:12094 stop:13104 length:1011 start_codon:yes stop_codon:yes gene_type:complete
VERIISKLWLLLIFCFNAYSEIMPVKKVYIERNNDLPQEVLLEITRAFFYNNKYQVTYSKTSDTKNLFRYYQEGSYILLEFEGKSEKTRYVPGEKRSLYNLRKAAFKILHGSSELSKVEAKPWFKKDYSFPVKNNSKKNRPNKVVSKVIKKEKPIIVAKKEDLKKNTKIQKAPSLKKEDRKIENKKPLGFDLVMGANLVYDSNSQYYPDEIKQSLSIEFGTRIKDQYVLTYEYRFLNLVKGEDTVVANRFHLLNLAKPVWRLESRRFKINLSTHLGLGNYQHSTHEDFEESSLLGSLGISLSFNQVMRIKLAYETAPNSETYQSVPTLNIGAGLNF